MYGPSVDRLTAYRGTIYYEGQGKRWLFVKKNIDRYGHNIEKREKRAGKLSKRLHGEKVKVILPTVDEDVSYDGKTLLDLENNKTILETLFHCRKAGGNEYIVDSVLTCHYPAAKHAKFSGEVYLINSWSNKVAEKDLKLKLPRKYVLMDERSGEASPILKIIHGSSSTRPAGATGGGSDR